jgi:hypothetical protein
LIDKKGTSKTNMVFWLSQREDKRESDATILVRNGMGARFDIGFIRKYLWIKYQDLSENLNLEDKLIMYQLSFWSIE